MDPYVIRETYPEFASTSIEELRAKLLFMVEGQVKQAREKREKLNNEVLGVLFFLDPPYLIGNFLITPTINTMCHHHQNFTSLVKPI